MTKSPSLLSKDSEASLSFPSAASLIVFSLASASCSLESSLSTICPTSCPMDWEPTSLLEDLFGLAQGIIQNIAVYTFQAKERGVLCHIFSQHPQFPRPAFDLWNCALLYSIFASLSLRMPLQFPQGRWTGTNATGSALFRWNENNKSIIARVASGAGCFFIHSWTLANNCPACLV